MMYFGSSQDILDEFAWKEAKEEVQTDSFVILVLFHWKHLLDITWSLKINSLPTELIAVEKNWL